MKKDEKPVPCVFTVMECENKEWLLIVTPEEDITYLGFLDAMRSFLRQENELDDTGPKANDPVC